MALWLGLGALVSASVLIAIYLLQPTQTEAQLEFRLLFSGVEQGQYPNLTRFTPADIIAEPVLRVVYDKHASTSPIPFDEFKHAFAVLSRNTALNEFRLEYRERLENNSLSQVERLKLEDDYASRASALRNGEYVLVGRMRNGWPAELPPGILAEILKAWEEQARGQGAFKFNLNIFSPNIIADIAPYRDDYLVLLDRIRVTINRLLANIALLESIPGAAMVRAGPKQISLAEQKALLRDNLKYKLSLIEAPVYGLGLYRNQFFSEAYINEQIFRLKHEIVYSQGIAQSLERALASYSTTTANSLAPATGNNPAGGGTGGIVMPQLSESLINRMLDMTNAQSDIRFRQELSSKAIEAGRSTALLENERQIYENILMQLRNRDAAMEAQRATMESWVDNQSTILLESLRSALENAQILYAEISRRTLEPEALYLTPEPAVVKRLLPLGLGRLVIVFALAGFAFACLLLRAFCPADR